MILMKNARTLVVGTVISGVIFLLPGGYPYAPIVGGIFVGGLCRGTSSGARAGISLGLIFLPLGIALVALSTMIPITTGINSLIQSMSGMGTQSLLFYSIVVYFIALYTALVGGIFAIFSGSITRLMGKN